MRKLIFPALSLLFLTILAACSGKDDDTFRVEGEVAGSAKEMLRVERSDAAGRWMPIDSVATDADGHFRLDIPSAGASEIYRLVYKGKPVYFPIDSTETITVKTSAKAFDTNYTLDGSEGAKRLMNFEKDLRALPKEADAQQLKDFKRNVYGKYLQNAGGSIVSYFILTRQRGDKLLFDPSDPEDAKFYAAVATAYEKDRPDDQRTATLREVSLEAMRNASRLKGRKQVIEAPQVGVLDIDLPDTDGVKHKLSDVIGKGKPVVLAFVMMGAKDTPAFNVALREVYNRGDVDVYEVGFDADRHKWLAGARNLPWTNVYATEDEQSKTVTDYNLQKVPVCFLINASGDLVKRAENPKDLF